MVIIIVGVIENIALIVSTAELFTDPVFLGIDNKRKYGGPWTEVAFVALLKVNLDRQYADVFINTTAVTRLAFIDVGNRLPELNFEEVEAFGCDNGMFFTFVRFHHGLHSDLFCFMKVYL